MSMGRKDRFRQNVVRFLQEPCAALWVRHNSVHVADLDDVVRERFESLYRIARLLVEASSEEYRPLGEMHVVQLFLQRQGVTRDLTKIGGIPEILPELREAITDCRLIFDHFAQYAPKSYAQLFTSDGIIANLSNPHDVLVAMFYPERDGNGNSLPEWKSIEGLRSWIAMRAWFFIMDWVVERHAVKDGEHKLRSFTSYVERHIFSPPEEVARRSSIRFLYDDQFRFREFIPEDHDELEGACAGMVHLSHRIIKVADGRTVRVWFTQRVKQLAAFWGRLQRKGTVHDHAAATLVFESKQDFDDAYPKLKELFATGSVRDAHQNIYSSADQTGRLWVGHVTIPGTQIVVEVECQTLARYIDGFASLNIFNHGVYEVKRLVAPQSDSASIWEIFFPSSLYLELTPEVISRMVERQLMACVSDFILPNNNPSHAHAAVCIVSGFGEQIRQDVSQNFLKARVSF